MIPVFRRSGRRLLLALGCVTLLAACGSEQVEGTASTTSTTLEGDSWSEAVEQSCEALDREFAALSAVTPSDVEGAVELAEQVADYAAEFARRTSSLARGAELSPAVRRLDRAAGAMEDAATELREAAGEGDADAAAFAVARVEEAADALNELVAELSIGECGGW